MELNKLNDALVKYYKELDIECEGEIKELNNIKYLELFARVKLVTLNNQEIEIKCLSYENGTAQITFNFGSAYINSDLKKQFEDYNRTIFGLTAMEEFDEMRFYNRGFYLDVDNYMYNFGMVLNMFLSDRSVELIKPMLQYIKINEKFDA